MWSKLVAWLRRKRRERDESRDVERIFVVSLDDAGIAVRGPNGASSAIAWADVTRIVIATNDRGPWEPDVWWVLEGAGTGVSYPMGAGGEDVAMREIGRRFDGFDHTAVIDAMGSTDIATFVCWQRRAGA